MTSNFVIPLASPRVSRKPFLTRLLSYLFHEATKVEKEVDRMLRRKEKLMRADEGESIHLGEALQVDLFAAAGNIPKGYRNY